MTLPKHDPSSKQAQEAKPTILYVVRHTDVYNPGDILYGRLPRFGLSGLGVQQAEITARALAEEPLTTIYTSPRLRARQTGRIIAAAHPDARLRTSRLLDEVLTGYQGRPHADLESINFNFYDNPLQPGDETLEAVWRRLERFVGTIRKRHPGQTVAAVTHGDPVIIARTAYLGLPLTVSALRAPNVYPGKGSITRLVFPADLTAKMPPTMRYYDPNTPGAEWSTGWVALQPGKPFDHSR